MRPTGWRHSGRGRQSTPKAHLQTPVVRPTTEAKNSRHVAILNRASAWQSSSNLFGNQSGPPGCMSIQGHHEAPFGQTMHMDDQSRLLSSKWVRTCAASGQDGLRYCMKLWEYDPYDDRRQRQAYRPAPKSACSDSCLHPVLSGPRLLIAPEFDRCLSPSGCLLRIYQRFGSRQEFRRKFVGFLMSRSSARHSPGRTVATMRAAIFRTPVRICSGRG